MGRGSGEELSSTTWSSQTWWQLIKPTDPHISSPHLGFWIVFGCKMSFFNCKGMRWGDQSFYFLYILLFLYLTLLLLNEQRPQLPFRRFENPCQMYFEELGDRLPSMHPAADIYVARKFAAASWLSPEPDNSGGALENWGLLVGEERNSLSIIQDLLLPNSALNLARFPLIWKKKQFDFLLHRDFDFLFIRVLWSRDLWLDW